MAYKNIIFDIDGTLLDTEETGIGSLQKTIKDLLGRDMTFAQLNKYFGIPSFKTVMELDFQDKEEAGRVWEENYQALKDLIVPFKGVEKMLERLKREGKTVGIVTSRAEDEFNTDKYLHGWMHLFDFIVTSADSHKHKPDPAPMLAYLHKSGALPEECIYIGDTILDYQCSTGAGVDFALVDWKGNAPKDIPFKYIIRKVEDVFEIVG